MTLEDIRKKYNTKEWNHIKATLYAINALLENYDPSITIDGYFERFSLSDCLSPVEMAGVRYLIHQYIKDTISTIEQLRIEGGEKCQH